MADKGSFTKFLTVAGTVMVWLPTLAPVIFSVILLIRGGNFLFDFLMPAELFPSVLAGSAMVIWAAVRARSQRKLAIWSVVIGIVMLFGGQALAVATGLASGETEPVGIWWALVLGTLIAYDLAVLVTGITGIILIKNVFKPQDAG